MSDNPFDDLVASESGQNVNSAPQPQSASGDVQNIQQSGDFQNQHASSPSGNPFDDLVVSEAQQKSNQLKASQQPQVDTDPTLAAVASLGRGAASGLKGTVGPLYDTAAIPFNALGAKIKPFAQQIDEASPWPREAASAPERIVNKATETAGATLPMMATGAAMAESGYPLVQKIGTALASNPGSLLSSSTASGASEQGAKEAGYGPTGQMAAGFIGGAAPLISPSQFGRFLMDEGTTNSMARDFNTSAQAAATARPTWPQMRDIAGRAFEKANERGGLFTPDETNTFVQGASSVPTQPGAVREVAGETPVTRYVDNLQNIRDRPLTYEEVDGFEKDLTQKIQEERDPKTGFLSPQGQQWVAIQDKLRGITNDPGVVGAEGNEGFNLRKQAQGMWAQQARMQEIQQAFSRGASRQVPITGISNEFNAIKQNPARYNQYTPEEQKLIDQLASNSLTADAARTAGSRILNYLAIGHGNPAGMIASQVGTRMARDFGSSLKENTLNQLQDQILSRQELPELMDKPPLEPPGGLRNGRLLAPPASKSYPPDTSPRLLPRGDQDTFYTPQGRALTYQPRPDWEVTPEGFAQKPSDTAPPASRPAEGAIFKRAGENTADRNVKRLMITHQPRSDFVATDNGIAQQPSNRVGALLGEDQDMPIDAGELQAIRGNPKWPTEKRGGAINKAKGGRVIKRQKSYPAIEEMRNRA